MGAANLVVIVESVQSIVQHQPGSTTNAYHIPSLVAVGAALGKTPCRFVAAMRAHARRALIEGGGQ